MSARCLNKAEQIFILIVACLIDRWWIPAVVWKGRVGLEVDPVIWAEANHDGDEVEAHKMDATDLSANKDISSSSGSAERAEQASTEDKASSVIVQDQYQYGIGRGIDITAGHWPGFGWQDH